ncbi:MAG: restriction endonuclease subunit S [Acidimicrobiales bacterium]
MQSRGQGSTFSELSTESLADTSIAAPGLEEQRAIADYLDAETARIDALIAKKQQLILLLEERWIGAIEAELTHWPEAPLKRVARIDYGLGQPPTLSDEGIPILRATNIERGLINPENLIFAKLDDLPLDRAPLLSKGELLVVRSGAWTGDSALVTADWAGSSPGYDLRVFGWTIDSALVAYQFLGQRVWKQIELVRSRAAQPHLNAEELGSILIRVPTDRGAEAIALKRLEALDRSRKSTKLALKGQISLLAERRQALITAAVTGQFKVPGAA